MYGLGAEEIFLLHEYHQWSVSRMGYGIPYKEYILWKYLLEYNQNQTRVKLMPHRRLIQKRLSLSPVCHT